MSHERPSIVQAVVRLVPASRAADATSRPRCYRPFVIGPAILYRPRHGAEPWTVDVAEDGRLLPRVPTSPHMLRRTLAGLRRRGLQCRVATTLICPADVAAAGDCCTAEPRDDGRLRSEIYGWSLMYQPPGVTGRAFASQSRWWRRTGRAFVDRHDVFPELPACFELPLELIDRVSFLEGRGIRTRPIALITRPEDFEPVAGCWRNRFRPEARFARPCRLDRLL